ncbi:hypothetical protein OG394_16565 [Kribbella sp. NBC_01245]|uniref:hypothetical protein n=1 Tax=Kribbella sp. NBC_01245 TaxID=2903578 RepID=UPI002E2A0F85|nr:hypothetical protein [Kribbella sp. NBC_01245]
MARYEVIARAQVGRQLCRTDAIDLTLKGRGLSEGMRFERVEPRPDGEIAIVLHRKFSSRNPDRANELTHRTLAVLGIPASQVRQIDVHRLARGKCPTLVRSWVNPADPGEPGTAGDREPRNPLPNPPHLRAELDVPRDA